MKSAREIFEHHETLEQAECLKWLADMNTEIAAYRGRTQGVIGTCLGGEDIKEIKALFEG